MIIGDNVVDSPARTKLEVMVLDAGNAVEVVTQHGMRYPDGTIRWTSDGRHGYSFQKIAQGDRESVRQWENFLTKSAREVSIEPEAYVKSHVPVKRTVVLATTAPEEVPRVQV